MEFRICLYCIIFNCAVILPYLEARSVSLNELIANEEKKIKPHRKITTNTDSDTGINHRFLTSNLRKLTQKSPLLTQDSKISPLQYRKAFEIKSPLKPKRIKYFHVGKNKIRNQTKRETYQDGEINKKYIPLLKNIGLLFNNILGTDSSDTEYESRQTDYSDTDKSDEAICKCAPEHNVHRKKYEARKKAITAAGTITTEVTSSYPAEVTTTPTTSTTADNISAIRWNKNIPLLLTGDTTSFRRNNTRFRTGSGASHIGSLERYIPGNCGNHECNPRNEQDEPNTEDNEEDSHSDTRNNAISNRPYDKRRRIKYVTGNRGRIGHSDIIDQFKSSTDKSIESVTEHLYRHEGEAEFEVRRDKAESTGILRESNTRLPKFISHEESGHLQTTEDNKEYINQKSQNNTDPQRFSTRNSEVTAEVQIFRGTNETMILENSSVERPPADKFVIIYDGYSVAKDVNGKNTLVEKAINIHS